MTQLNSTFRITRRIGIDAGHRIRMHGSKCRHLHGHRYEIEATCLGQELHDAGEQAGMVLDFGFLKDEMMRVIDGHCDHGFIAELADRDVLEMFAPVNEPIGPWIEGVTATVREQGFAATTTTRLNTRLYVVPFPPTAEGLARHWFERLEDPVRRRSDGMARLHRIRVWETPNCWADWRGQATAGDV